jgi:hypothetical protein
MWKGSLTHLSNVSHIQLSPYLVIAIHRTTALEEVKATGKEEDHCHGPHQGSIGRTLNEHFW